MLVIALRPYYRLMCAAELPDGFFYDDYIDSGVCARPIDAISSLEAHSFGLSYCASPQHLAETPSTPSRSLAHRPSTDISTSGNQADTVYLLDGAGLETELDTTFGDQQVGKQPAEDDVLLSYQALVARDSDYDFSPFRVGLPGDTWYDRAVYSSSAYRFNDGSTTCHSPSTGSLYDIGQARAITIPVPKKERSGMSSMSLYASSPGPLSASPTTANLTASGSHSCHVCSRSFKLLKDLKRHTSSIHDLERSTCPEPGCHQVFSRRDKVLRHRRLHHRSHNTEKGTDTLGLSSSAPQQPTRNIVLPVEQARLDQSTEHNSVESGRPSPSLEPASLKTDLSCDFCKKTFALRTDLLRHVRTLHRKQEGLVYRCAVPGCTKGDKVFNRLDNFKKHLKIVHQHDTPDDIVSRSKTKGGDTFSVTTPAMYSSSR